MIAKNSNDKLLSGGSKDKFHFDANGFIGKLQGDDAWDIKWVNTVNLTRYENYNDASKRIRDIYFKEFKTIKNNKGESLYRYNLDDKRFWEGPMWHQLESITGPSMQSKTEIWRERFGTDVDASLVVFRPNDSCFLET